MPAERILRNRFWSLRLLVALSAFFAGCGNESISPIGEEVRATPTVHLRVTVADLKNLVKDDNTRILDVRDRAAYKAGHVPGAVWVDVGEWAAQAGKGDGAGLTDKAAWEALVRKLGIDDLNHVVVIGDSLPGAARIWWLLKYLSVEDAGILDGGWQQWEKAGGESSTETTPPKTGDFNVAFQKDRLAVTESLKETHKSDDVQMIDARGDGEVAGGMIPGAIHLEWKTLSNPDGTMKSDEELKQIFTDKKLSQEKTVVTYCYSGMRASVNAYALELAGYKTVKNYYGSWRQWKAGKLPVEKPTRKTGKKIGKT